MASRAKRAGYEGGDQAQTPRTTLPSPPASPCSPNCSSALRDYDARQQAALARSLYEAHFRDGKNIADHTELTGLAERFSLNGSRVRSFLASEEGVAEVREQGAAARQDGITSVPTFVSESGELLGGESATETILDDLDRGVNGR